jgi:hypothetical protein
MSSTESSSGAALTMPAEPQPDQDAAGLADGLRELGDVWRVGLDTAQVMAERVLDAYRDLPATARMVSGEFDAELRRVRMDLERAVDLSMDVLDRVLTMASRMDPLAAGRDGKGAVEVVELEVAAGDTGSAEFWVHNVSAASSPAPDLRASALTSFDGDTVAETHVRVECAAQPIEAQNSRQVEVFVDVTAGTPAGVYHGLILSGDDESSMRVRLRVTE